MTCSRGMVCFTIYSRTTCKASLVAFRPTFNTSSSSSKSASLASVRGALLSACSSTPQRQRFCGLVRRQIFARYHQGVKSLASARTTLNQWRSFDTLVCWSTRSCQCVNTWLSCLGHASSTCADSDLCVDNSGVMLLQDLRWCCRDWITVTPSLQDSQGQHWRHCSESCTPLPTCPEPARSCDACSSGTALVVSPAEDRVQGVFTGPQDTARQFAKVPQRPVDPRCWHTLKTLSPVIKPRWLHCVTYKWQVRRQSFFCCCSPSLEQTINGT